MKTFSKELTIILAFAVLHAVMAVITRWLGLSDHLMLTTLTMLMAVTLCQFKSTNVYTMIVLLIIVNFGGFYLGRAIGRFLRLFVENSYVRGSITTFTTTGIIGFVISSIIYWLKRKNLCHAKKEIGTYWLLLAFTVIIIGRLVLIIINDNDLYKENVTLNIVFDYTFFCVAFLYLAINAVKEAHKAQEAIATTKIAQYSYIRLQQQVKPHFMFNNLNILNSLICDHQIKEASDFVYKLAYLYRYMIETEDEKLVPLREEMDFVGRYTDLMKVRFESSFNVEIDLDEDSLSYLVVPCSIQLLIENAIKHNGGTAQTSLRIRIYKTSERLIIWNNRLEKNSSEPSTHLGLKYIKQLYADLSSEKVIVESDKEEFIVKLPIIN